jgi:hypothetical protein
MDRQDEQLPEQMSWVDYCDSLSNEHAWPKMGAKPAYRTLARMPQPSAVPLPQREQMREPA